MYLFGGYGRDRGFCGWWRESEGEEDVVGGEEGGDSVRRVFIK